MADKRIYGVTKNYSISDLKEKLSTLDYIKDAVLFGSRVSNNYHPKSDYDIAVIIDDIDEPWGKQAKAWNDIQDLLELDDNDLDLIDLDNANELIKSSIKQNYILLKGDEDEIKRLLKSNQKDC